MTDRDARAAKERFIETLDEKLRVAKQRGGACLECGVVDLLEIELWKLRNPPPIMISWKHVVAFLGSFTALMGTILEIVHMTQK